MGKGYHKQGKSYLGILWINKIKKKREEKKLFWMHVDYHNKWSKKKEKSNMLMTINDCSLIIIRESNVTIFTRLS